MSEEVEGMERDDGDYPASYCVQAVAGLDEGRPKVFEPAFKSYPCGFRLGDPLFQNDADRKAWFDTRQKVLEHVLCCLARASSAESLILRGSMLMRAWFGDAARPPCDIDFVFKDPESKADDMAARCCVDELVALVASIRPGDEVEILDGTITVDEIWAYERASGRRIAFVWQAEGMPPGSMQIDVVFGERMPMEPAVAVIGAGTAAESRWLAALPELALVWKILWLHTDYHPQGKDLYDAVLLAESAAFRLDLLYPALEAASPWYAGKVLACDFPMEWDGNIDWKNFLLEYPGIAGGEAKDWLHRLERAVAPTFSGGVAG